MSDLDQKLAALGRADVDRDLRGLEDAVWARIDVRGARGLPPMPRRLAATMCAATALAASMAGAAAAAALQAPHPATSAFAIETPWAPSTALNH